MIRWTARVLCAGMAGFGALGLAPAHLPAAEPPQAALRRSTDPALAAMVEAAWRREDGVADNAAALAAAAKRHAELAQRLLDALRAGRPAGTLSAETLELGRLAKASPDEKTYLDLRWLKRRIALSNPLLNFDRLLFCKRSTPGYSHLVMQYFGWRARPGGGLFVLERPGASLACRDILDGKLAAGCVLEPRLSYDGKRIVFSYVKCVAAGFSHQNTLNESGPDEGYYHIYEVNADGTGLRQLTRGPYDDLMPAYLPDGGIVFSSTRRRGYARCFGGQFARRWHVYTLHRMDADGSNLRALSFHDTNEWFPSVGPNGLIYYARWDYIDRDAVTHQNLWATRPDGTNAIAVWGNAETRPHCMFQSQPIPGTNRFVFTASAHHAITGGSIAIVDPSRGVNGHAAIVRITPEVPFPEAERPSKPLKKKGYSDSYYASPWPLSENYFLVSFSDEPLIPESGPQPAHSLGLYLLDAFGNRELLYRDPAIGCESACPLVPRPAPPAVPNVVPPGAPPEAEVVLTDVYQGLGDLPRGRIAALRLVQILPKTTPLANNPPVGLAGEENARAILGTVPVEPDGSARFRVPACKPILFQAIDVDGFAYQTMRTISYFQPGERAACGGCHENRMAAPVGPRSVMAMRRPPSAIDPGPLGGQPFSYPRFVQPVLDRQCVRCHGGEKTEGKVDLTAAPDVKHKAFSRSYVALMSGRDLVQRFAARNQIQITPPGGRHGALGSRLMKLAREDHHGVRLADADVRVLAAWIDCNAIFYGVNDPEAQRRQFAAERVPMPEVQ